MRHPRKAATEAELRRKLQDKIIRKVVGGDQKGPIAIRAHQPAAPDPVLQPDTSLLERPSDE